METSAGDGTVFLVRLPLTLAIIDGQLVTVGRQNFVIPLLSIVESIQVERDCVSRFAGQYHVYRFRDDYIPMIDLAGLFGVGVGQPRGSGGLMVVVEADDGQIGLLVDDLAAQQQVVVKSLETNYEKVQGLSGATILGDGSVAFILDTGELAMSARDPRAKAIWREVDGSARRAA